MILAISGDLGKCERVKERGKRKTKEKEKEK
jgi:hypothetical protein